MTNENSELIQVLTREISVSFDAMDNRFESIESEVHKINLKLENIIEPKIQNIYENQLTITEFQSIIVKMSAKLDKHDGDVDLLKKTVSNHSKEIAILKKRA